MNRYIDPVNHNPIDSKVNQTPGLFSYHKESKTITAFASDLSINNNISYVVGSMVTVYNPKTRNSMSFILSQIERYPERCGDVQSYIYKATNASFAKHYGVNELKIFND